MGIQAGESPLKQPTPREPEPEIEEAPPVTAAKPRAKRAPWPRVEPEYEAEPPAPAYDPRQIAAEVLGFLSNGHVQRQADGRAKYQSWFANPAYCYRTSNEPGVTPIRYLFLTLFDI